MSVKMSQEYISKIDLIGGEFCLDFVNTVGNHKGDSPNEHLDDYADLVVWSRHAGILSSRATYTLLHESKKRPDDARQVYEQAIVLREALYRIFAARSTRTAPKGSDLGILNTWLGFALRHTRVIPRGAYFAWGWETLETALDRMLWPIVRSAADLLTSDRVERVRECEGDRCGWLFIDASKNHSRRWCSMGDCGNRAKAQRFYRRRRIGTAPSRVLGARIASKKKDE